MRKFFALLAAVISISPALAAESSQVYLRYLPDVPLLAGMKELEDQSVLFDKAEGRVIESVVLAGGNDARTVENFYAKTLPALGWEKAAPDRFLRNDEQLIVKWDKVSGEPVVRFAVSPKQGQKQAKNF